MQSTSAFLLRNMVNKYSFFGAPGVFTRCDRQVSCVPFADRAQASLDFLCCEDIAWVAAHVLNPALIGLMFGWKASLIVAFWFEVFEVLLLVIFDSFVFTTTSDLDRETLSGSVLGDAFLGGSLGAILVYQICELTRFVPPFQRWKNMANNWHRAKYVALFFAVELCFELTRLTDFYEWAILLTIPALFIAFKLIFEPLTNFPADVQLVWRGQQGVRARNNAFLLFVVVACLIIPQNAGLKYMANDYFQERFIVTF